MALDASVLTVRVQSDGIENTTKALSDLAKAGENAEKKTSNIGNGAKASAKAQVDAAQQAASAYNAIIDMMTEKSNEFYANKAMKAALASQQELFDGMSLADKLTAIIQQSQADRAAMREKESADIRAKQQQQMDAAQAWYAQQQEMANRMNAIYDKKQSAKLGQDQEAAILEDKRRGWQALGVAQAEALKINAQIDAANKRLEQDHGAAILEDKKRAWKALGQAQSEAMAMNAKMDSDAKQLKADGDAFVATLKRQAETVGMTTKELREYNAEQLRTRAAQLGVTQQVEGHINTLKNAKGPHESFNLLTAGSARELMVLGHELSQGQFQRFGGSLIVLAERVNFLPSLLEKGAVAANAMGVSFGLLAASTLGVVAAIAFVGYELFKGASEMNSFNKNLILTGGYAGQTRESLEAMAIALKSQVHGEIGTTTDMLKALVATGKFSSETLESVATAALNFKRLTGKSTEDVAEYFGTLVKVHGKVYNQMTNATADWAAKANESYHFLSVAQYEHIRLLAMEGKQEEAIKETMDAMTASFNRQEVKLGVLSKIYEGWVLILQNAAHWLKEVGKDWFADTSTSDSLAKESAKLEKYMKLKHDAKFGGKGGLFGEVNLAPNQADYEMYSKLVTQQLAKVRDLESKDTAEREARLREADNARLQEIGIQSQREWDALKSRNRTKDQIAADDIAKIKDDAANINKAAVSAWEVKFQGDKSRMEAEKQLAIQNGQIKLITEEEINKQIELERKRNHDRTPKPHTEGLSGLDRELNRLNSEYDVQKRVMDYQIKMIDFKNQYGLMKDEDAMTAKTKILDAELALEKDHLDKSNKAVDDFHTKDVRLANDAMSKKYNFTKRLEEVNAQINFNKEKNELVPDVNAAAEAAKQQKEQDTIMKQIERQTKQVQAQVDAYNNLPDAVKAVGVRQKEMASEVEQAKIDTLNAEKDALQKGDAAALASSKVRVDQIDKEIEERNKLKGVLVQKEANDKQNNEALNRSSALTKIATEQVKLWKDAGNEIEKSLKAAFGNSGKAAGEMFKAFTENQAQQIDLANQIRVVKEKEGLTDEERTRQVTALQDSSAQSAIAMYGNMSDAASGFFDKQSTGYKIATSVSKAFHLAETAMALASIPAKLAAGAATMFAQSGWGGFAGVAAMTAAVAAFGVAVTSGGGGGPMSSQMQQKVQGTGTVLGAPTILDGVDVKLVGQKSDSIANSLKIAEKNSGLGLVVQNDMLNALNKLSSSIDSFATLAVQNSGLTGITAQTTNGGAYNFGSSTAGVALTGGVFGLVLDKLTGGLVGKITGKILGGILGGKTSVDDTGLMIGKTSIGQVESGGLLGSQYTNTTTSGGWFRSDKHNTATQSLGAEFNDQITKVVLSMEDTLKTAAVGLGMGGDAFNEKLKSFVVDIGNISLKGMTGDEIQKTLQNVFSKLGDQMAQFAFSDLQQYQKIGEGLMETVVRVANDLQQVKDVFDSLSKTIPATVNAIAMSEALVSQFGSVDNLTKGVKSYINAIYTDQEKLLPIIKSVNTAMDGLGLSYVKTKEQFKQVVDSLDLTTEAGAKMFATLMNIAPAFAQTIDDTEKIAQDARSALTDAYKRESEAIKDTQDKMKDFVKTLKQLTSGSLLGDLSPLTPQQKYLESKSQFETIAQKAQGGDKDAQEQFEASYSAFLEASKTANASGSQYQKDFQYAQSVAQKLTDWGQKQVDVAQATLEALNKQVEGLIDVNEGLISVSQAIANLIKALKGTPEGDKVANQAASNAQAAIEKLYNDILHRASDTTGMQFWMQKVKEGISLTDIANAIANSPEAKGEIKPIGTAGATQAIAPVTANVSSQSASNADVVKAVNQLNTTIVETSQNTNNNLVGAMYDSQDKASDKTVHGVSSAVTSNRSNGPYKIVER